MSPQVVVVSADGAEQQSLVRYLAAHGFRAAALADGAELLPQLRQAPSDMVLLDADLPDVDSIGLVREVHTEQPRTGVILVAPVEARAVCVQALDAGADDYIARPFDPRELLARVRSVLRRLPPPDPGLVQRRVRIGRCVFDPARGELQDGGSCERLGGPECALLSAFAANPHRPLDAEWLNQVTQIPAAPDAPPIARQVESLRCKVERDPARPAAIRDIAGIGYMFVPEPS